MAKHLTDKDIANIASLIDQWPDTEKFSWDGLCKLANKRYAIESTRQTLQSHVRIKSAFDEKKKVLRTGVKSVDKTPPSLKIAAKRISTIEAENTRLKKEQDMLLAQFVVWQYNAYAHGITMEQLNRPMPKKSN